MNDLIGNDIKEILINDKTKNEKDILLAEPKGSERCLEKMKEDDTDIEYKCLNLKDISRSSVLVDDINDLTNT